MVPIVVIDAMVALRLAEHDRFDLDSARLVAPRLLWSECANVLHRSMARRGAHDGPERVMHDRIAEAPIDVVDEFDRRVPWDIASLLGWRTTYDAEYLAVARHLGAPICTLDQRMLDGARRLGIPIVTPG